MDTIAFKTVVSQGKAARGYIYDLKKRRCIYGNKVFCFIG